MGTRKKQEVALQQEVETQEEWEELLAREGLIIAEVCQKWCGYSQAMLSTLKDALTKTNHDKMIILAAAKADTIDALERYRGKCEPCFLFYAGGCLVAVVRGANGPVVTKTLLSELQKEKKVLEGAAERIEIHDPAFAHLEKKDDDEKDFEDEDELISETEELVPKEVTVAIIKPDVVAAGKVEDVITRIKAAGIEILKHEERQLTEAEARQFYSHLSESNFFDELVRFMCSGLSHVLLLSKPASAGHGIIQEWRELLGPNDAQEAKLAAPNSWRAEFGTSSMQNALHGSDSGEAAARELAFFFPGYSVPKVPKSMLAPVDSSGPAPVQRTLALIRPDALVLHKDAILQKIQEAGFTIAMQKEVQLSKEQATNFYKEHADQPYFEELIDEMTSGPLLALGLARADAISTWRSLLGPKEVEMAKVEQPQSFRAQFSVPNRRVNMLHGSSDSSTASKELEIFFPAEETVAVIKPEAYANRDAIMEKIKEAGFHIAARKETVITKEMAEMMYSNCSDKAYYEDLINHMTSGPTLFMVLSKEDAVKNWRGLMGATDPALAKVENPASLRALFGNDIKANALHGSSTLADAAQVIQKVFGDDAVDPQKILSGSESDSNVKDTNETDTGDGTAAEPEAEEKTSETIDTTDDSQTQDNSGVNDNDNHHKTAESDGVAQEDDPSRSEQVASPAAADVSKADEEQRTAAEEDTPAAADENTPAADAEAEPQSRAPDAT